MLGDCWTPSLGRSHGGKQLLQTGKESALCTFLEMARLAVLPASHSHADIWNINVFSEHCLERQEIKVSKNFKHLPELKLQNQQKW